jgi:GNAT superfamily N-acetyltransferase
MEDLDIVHALNLAYDLASFGEEDFTLDDLRAVWSSPTHDLERDERLIFTRNGQLIASLYLDQRSFTHFFIDVQLHPAYEDERPAAFLLDLGEQLCRERMTQAEPGERVSMYARISEQDERVVQRYLRAGFQENRRFWRMQIILNEAPAQPVWPEGVELRPFVPERDARAVYEMMETAFSDHWGHVARDFATWRSHHVEHPGFDPSLWFLAWQNDQPVGGALCAQKNCGWVNTLGVLRPWRRLGLGLALLYRAFAEFYSRGERRILLGVDSQSLTGATRLYERAGMSVVRVSVALEKELRAGIETSTHNLVD